MIPSIIFAIAFALLGYGYIKSKMAFNSGLLEFKNYSGEFRDCLDDCVRMATIKYPSFKFSLMIYTGKNKDRISYSAPSISGWVIYLCEPNIRDTSWMKDFNLMADYWGFKRLSTLEDHAKFLFFHEFKHYLQALGEGEFHPIEVNSITSRFLAPHHAKPIESDADYFAFNQIKQMGIL